MRAGGFWGLYQAASASAGEWTLWSLDSWVPRGGPWNSLEEAEAALAAMGLEPDPGPWGDMVLNGRNYIKVRSIGGGA